MAMGWKMSTDGADGGGTETTNEVAAVVEIVVVGTVIEVSMIGAVVGLPLVSRLVIIVPVIPIDELVIVGRIWAVPFEVGIVVIDTSGTTRVVSMGTSETGLGGGNADPICSSVGIGR